MEWNFRADAPIYTQLTEQLTLAIVSGVFAAGERLPAVRELALDAGVNPNTVQRALSELERTGLVYSQRTAGRFVTGDAERIGREKQRLAGETAAAFLAAMERLGYDGARSIALLRQMKEEKQ